MSSNRTGYNNVIDLLKAFPDEAACAKHLEWLRWPHSITCPLCDNACKIHHLSRPGIYKCGDCKR